MMVSEQEIQDLKNFIVLLNSKSDSVVIVEGKRDSEALKKLGFSGRVLEFHKFRGLRKIVEQLERRVKIDLSFKRKLVSITKGKVRFIEELDCYKSFL